MVRLADNGPANLEVWNATGNKLITRMTLPVTAGVETLTFGFRVTHQYPNRIFSGKSLFTFSPTPLADPNNQIELRVWTPGNEVVNVYALSVQSMPQREGTLAGQSTHRKDV